MHKTSNERVDITNAGRPPLRIVEIPGRGRGVVAVEPIAAGTVIERAPAVVVPEADRTAVDPSEVGSYIFVWEPDSNGEDVYTLKGRVAVVLGYASIINHASEPNCDFIRYIEAKAMDVIAMRDIAAGEELTFDYGMSLWFDPK